MTPHHPVLTGTIMNRDAYPRTRPFQSKPKSHRFCRLASGSVHLYNHATATNEPPTPQATYIGQGVIYSINGVLQEGKTLLHFWV